MVAGASCSKRGEGLECIGFAAFKITPGSAQVELGFLVKIEAQSLAHLAELSPGDNDLARVAAIIHDDLFANRVHAQTIPVA